MLAKNYFGAPKSNTGKIEDGAFNVAIQDGKLSGQSVPHVHVHIIPRTKDSADEGDAIYDRLQGEEGNVGGGLWDQERPKLAAKFKQIEDGERRIRSKEEMNEEAAFYREQMELVE